MGPGDSMTTAALTRPDLFVFAPVGPARLPKPPVPLVPLGLSGLHLHGFRLLLSAGSKRRPARRGEGEAVRVAVDDGTRLPLPAPGPHLVTTWLRPGRACRSGTPACRNRVVSVSKRAGGRG